MNATNPTMQPDFAGQAGRLSYTKAALLALGAGASFHLAFTFAPLCWLVLAYLGCLFELRRVSTARQAFYYGLAVGLGVFVPQMTFLWTIFGPAAIPLWLILAFFHGLFLLVLHRVEVRLGTKWAVWLAPVLWCGIEYFRSEVWWLRFAWFAAGSVLDSSPRPNWWFGVYGAGLLLFQLAQLAIFLIRLIARKRSLADWPTVACWVLLAVLLPAFFVASKASHRQINVAGIQLEFPGPPEVVIALDRLAKAHPEAELLMLSEYTFDGPVPDSVKAWCKRNGKWLVAGGKQPIAGERYYNTAFVISTNGEVVFSQAKSRPIQFFKDGEPAREQRVWDSPWGKLGIAICYDVSYRRVTDELIRQGARALLVPTMDVEQWGEHEHRLNARMARLRAAEYGVPVFRVASSGISQLIRANGTEAAAAPFPGPGEMIAGELRLSRGGSLPVDRWLAPACSLATGGVIVMLLLAYWQERRNQSLHRVSKTAFSVS